MKKSLVLSLFLVHVFMTAAQEVDSITDIRDGRIYRIIKIGNQWWMQENLNIGTRIDRFQAPSDNGDIEKYCYDNSDSLCTVYGGLYRWNEMMDYNPSDSGTIGTTQGICPEGWHVPTDSEWKALKDFLGYWDVGGKIKEAGTVHWESENAGATNESGFTALPGGHYGGIATFTNICILADFWSSTENESDEAWGYGLSHYSKSLDRDWEDKEYGFSVRCVKDE